MPKFKVYYQPDPELTVIDWSWTLLILVISIIFWLEVTHFQWITLWLMIFFFVVGGLEVLGRRIIVSRQHLVVRSLFFLRIRTFRVQGPVHFLVTGHRLLITEPHHRYGYLISKRSGQRLRSFLKS